LNLNPQVEGNTLTVNIPKPSKETRESYIKIIHKNGEKVSFLVYNNYILFVI